MRRWTVLAVAVPLVIAVAGCGSSKKSSSSSGGSSGNAYSPPSKSSTTTSAKPTGAAGSTVKLAADEEGKLYFNPPDQNVAAMSPGTVANTGGSQAHLNMQPYLTLSFCIALEGIYPSQS